MFYICIETVFLQDQIDAIARAKGLNDDDASRIGPQKTAAPPIAQPPPLAVPPVIVPVVPVVQRTAPILPVITPAVNAAAMQMLNAQAHLLRHTTPSNISALPQPAQPPPAPVSY